MTSFVLFHRGAQIFLEAEGGGDGDVTGGDSDVIRLCKGAPAAFSFFWFFFGVHLAFSIFFCRSSDVSIFFGVNSALVLVGGLRAFFFFFFFLGGWGRESVSIPLLIGFWEGSTERIFSKGVGSDVIRLLGGLCKGAPRFFFFFSGGRGSLAFHP